MVQAVIVQDIIIEGNIKEAKVEIDIKEEEIDQVLGFLLLFILIIFNLVQVTVEDGDEYNYLLIKSDPFYFNIILNIIF